MRVDLPVRPQERGLFARASPPLLGLPADKDHNQPLLVLRLLPAAEATAKLALQPCSQAPMTGPGAVAGGVIVCHTSMKPDGPFSLTPVVKFWRVLPLVPVSPSLKERRCLDRGMAEVRARSAPVSSDRIGSSSR